jgi:hypothetical protein
VNRDDLSETQALAGEVSQWLFDEWCAEFGDLRLGGEKYRRAGLEDAEELGYGDDNTTLLIIRESDGKVFEVELEANVYEVPSKEERDKRAAEAAVLLERYKAAGGGS